jgi:hypothetical protein
MLADPGLDPLSVRGDRLEHHQSLLPVARDLEKDLLPHLDRFELPVQLLPCRSSERLALEGEEKIAELQAGGMGWKARRGRPHDEGARGRRLPFHDRAPGKTEDTALLKELPLLGDAIFERLGARRGLRGRQRRRKGEKQKGQDAKDTHYRESP